MYRIVIILCSIQCSTSYSDYSKTRSSKDTELVITGLNGTRTIKQEQTSQTYQTKSILHYIYKDGEQINMHCGRRDGQATYLEYMDCDLTKIIEYKENSKQLSFSYNLSSATDHMCILCVQRTGVDGYYVQLNKIEIVFHFEHELVITGLNETRISRTGNTLHYTYKDGELINLHCGRRDKRAARLQYLDCGDATNNLYIINNNDLSYTKIFFSNDDKVCKTCIQWTKWDGGYVEMNNIKIVFHLKHKLVITGLNESRISQPEDILHYTYKDTELIDIQCGRRDKQTTLLQYRACDSEKTTMHIELNVRSSYKMFYFSQDDTKCLMCVQWTQWDGTYVELNNIKIVFHLKQRETSSLQVTGLDPQKTKTDGTKYDYTYDEGETVTVTCTPVSKENNENNNEYFWEKCIIQRKCENVTQSGHFGKVAHTAVLTASDNGTLLKCKSLYNDGTVCSWTSVYLHMKPTGTSTESCLSDDSSTVPACSRAQETDTKQKYGVFINGLAENNIHKINETYDEYTFNVKEERTVHCILNRKSKNAPLNLSFDLLDSNDNVQLSADTNYGPNVPTNNKREKQMKITFYEYHDKNKFRCTAKEQKPSQSSGLTYEKTIILHMTVTGAVNTETNDTIVFKDTTSKPVDADKNSKESSTINDFESYTVSIIILIAVLILFIIVIVYLVRSRHRKPSNRLSETEMNYENLSKKPEVPPNKPVVPPNKPVLSPNKPAVPPNKSVVAPNKLVKEDPTYSEPADKEPFYTTVATPAADSSTYSRPYIEKDLTELYAQPIPKSERKKLEDTVIYAQVLPMVRGEYQNLKDNKKSNKYANLGSNGNLNETKDSSKYVNVDNSSQNYTNVFDDGLYVNSNSNDEYAEPAYCGVK